MAHLILQMQISVDGRVQAADPSQRWQLWNWGAEWPWDASLRERFNSTFERSDAILLSRKMAQEGYLDHWAGVAEATRDDADFRFARRITSVDKLILSSELEASEWEKTTVLPGGFGQGVAALKDDRRTLLTFGGTGFASALLAAGAVDELELFINPTAVGLGESIFAPTGMQLHLLDSVAYECGVVVTRYQPHNQR